MRTSIGFSSLALTLSVLVASCSNDLSPAEHQADVRAWQEWRLADLTAEDSWLTLIGYHWIRSTPVRIGSAPENDLVLPRGPDYLGQYVDLDGVLHFEAEASSGLSSGLAMGPEGESVVHRFDDMSWFVRDFQDRLAIRVRDNRTDLRMHFPGLTFFPINQAWRLRARFEAYDPPKQFPVAIFTGGEALEESPGRVIFRVADVEYSLDVTDTSETGYFVIFGDETNRQESYPAGRYVWFDKPEGESGPVVLDFNKSYNPPCAFTDFATCPLPPPAHRIQARIEAGEYRFSKP